MSMSTRIVIMGSLLLVFLPPLKADFPEDDLSFIGLTRHTGDIPNCVALREGLKICTWRATDDEYYTCIVESGSARIIKSDCVYEALKDRVGYLKRDEWEERYALASRGVNTGSVLEVSRTVGHGPVVCMLAEVILCKWETDNHSPGHQDSLRYLALADRFSRLNPHIRLLCEFDLETLERTDTPCVITALY